MFFLVSAQVGQASRLVAPSLRGCLAEAIQESHPERREVSRCRSASPGGAIRANFAANPGLGKKFDHEGTKDTKHSRRRQDKVGDPRFMP